MNIFKKFSKINRQTIFLLLSLAVIIPMVVSFNVRFFVDRSTQSLFDAIDRIPPNSRPVLISFDYDPQIMAELDPMALAVLRHCFARNIRVIGMTTGAQGASLGERAMTRIAKEYNKEYGKDYVYFGYKLSLVILYLGESAKKSFPVDHYGTPFDSLPMMKSVRNYDDIPLVVDIAGSTIANTWIVYAGARYHVNLGLGVTAVTAPDFYQFLQTGQLVGQLSGMKGAAEYEQLIIDHGYTKERGVASRAMNAISFSHILLIVLITLGNIGYFASRQDTKKTS